MIRGETDHYDYVCGEAARGIQQVQLETGVPCGFGVLTVDTMAAGARARRRAGPSATPAAHAAQAALASLAIKEQLQSRRAQPGFAV